MELRFLIYYIDMNSNLRNINWLKNLKEFKFRDLKERINECIKFDCIKIIKDL